MTLDDWLTRTATKEDSFAASIGTSQAAVNRYRHGRRVPRPAVMARIAAATGGAVTANDFHAVLPLVEGRDVAMPIPGLSRLA